MKLKNYMLFAVMLLALALTGCGAMAPDAATSGDQSVTLGNTATLSAAGSDKKNGETLTYHWSIVSAPVGSQAQLVNPTSSDPTFTPDMVGEYVFQLVVNNDWHDSDSVQVKVTCTAGPRVPVVNATDPTLQISMLDLTAVENSRTATHVNFSLTYSLKNATTAPVNITFTIRGLATGGAEVFSQTSTNSIASATTKSVMMTLGEVLTHAQYDSIIEWKVDPITVNP